LSSQVKSIGVVALLAFGIAAAQLLPTAELMLQSSRGPGGDFDIERANQHSFPLYHLPTALFPRFLGNDDTYWGKRLQIEYGIFIGSIPLVLALWQLGATLRRARHTASRGWRAGKAPGRTEFREAQPAGLRKRNWSEDGEGPGVTGPAGGSSKAAWTTPATKVERFFFYLLIISFFLALGDLSPFRLLGLEPSLWIFSSPARWLLFTTFSLAYFAALGFDQLASAPRKSFAIIAVAAASLSIIATLTLFGLSEERVELLGSSVTGALPTEYYQEKLATLLSSARSSTVSLVSPFTLLPLLALGALPLAVKAHYGRKLLLGVTTVELVVVAAAMNPTLPWKTVLTAPETIGELPVSVSDKQARILSLPKPGDTGHYLTNPATRADDAQREAYRQLLVPLTHTLFNIQGVEWPASLDLAGHDQMLAAVRDDATNEQAQKATIGAILSQHNEEIRILPLEPAPRAEIVDGLAQYRAITPGHTEIIVDASRASEVIIRDSYYPGWRAAVDGRPVPIEKTEKIFRSLNVTAGQHVITMTYHPTLLYIGLLVTAITLLLSAVLMLKA
jgi:hypothetical protein